MALNFGVLRGMVDRFLREDNNNSPHLQIRIIDGNNQAWRVPVNVLSQDKSFLVFHRVDPLLNHPILGGLSQAPPGFTPLPAGSRSTATSLDYFRAPLFDWPTGIAIPPFGPGQNDDLQDTISTYLNQLKAQDGELYIFGAKWPEPGQASAPRPIDQQFGTEQGVHDVHMNQGNPSGSFAKDNGVFQDGGLILKFPSRVAGLFFRFQTQWLPTDNATGHRLPNARPIPPDGAPAEGGQPGTIEPGTPPPGNIPSVSHPIVYIERALINPMGEDPGKEAVVIGNTSSSAVDLTGWKIADKNDQMETIPHLILPAGESRIVILSGNHAQLGNKGGTIRLKNPAGEQVHAVSYSKADADEQSRYIRFNT